MFDLTAANEIAAQRYAKFLKYPKSISKNGE